MAMGHNARHGCWFGPALGVAFAFLLSACILDWDLPAGTFDLQLQERDPAAAARDYVRRTPSLGIGTDHVVRAVRWGDTDNICHISLLEAFKGVPVLGGRIDLEVDKKSGRTLDTETDAWIMIPHSTSVTPGVSRDQALQLAQQAWPPSMAATWPYSNYYEEGVGLVFYSLHGESVRLGCVWQTVTIACRGMAAPCPYTRRCPSHQHLLHRSQRREPGLPFCQTHPSTYFLSSA